MSNRTITITRVVNPSALAALQALARKAATCTACSLGESRQCSVFSDGHPHAPLMLIGEAPGQQEAITGRPFVGRSGQLLRRLLAEAGISVDTDVYICNTIKCRPPKNRPPKPEELAACRPFLLQQIEWVQPRLIGLVGATALKGVLGHRTPMTQIRGQWLDTPFSGVTAMALFHPAYLLRNAAQRGPGSAWALMEQDIQVLKLALDTASETASPFSRNETAPHSV
jgi:uracil-DNA glycosylase